MLFLVFSTFGAIQNAEALTRTRRGRGPVTPVGTFVRKGILFDAAYYFGSNDFKSTTTNTSLNQTSFLDLKLGYINQAAFYYGAQYTLRNDATRTTKTDGRGTGFGIGYFLMIGFDARVYYRFNESYSDYSQGSGYQIDIGYSARVISNVYLGVIIDYRDITYKSYSADPTIKNTVIRTLQPSVSLGYLF